MKDFFNRMIHGNQCFPPEKIKSKLFDSFKSPVDVEWSRKTGYYEAIFYIEFKEYLARFSEDGLLIDYRINLPIDELPEEISNIVIPKGEIMSALSIHASGGVNYQIIYCDRSHQRHMMLIGQKTEILEEKTL
jgi:hypothetical protein